MNNSNNDYEQVFSPKAPPDSLVPVQSSIGPPCRRAAKVKGRSCSLQNLQADSLVPLQSTSGPNKSKTGRSGRIEVSEPYSRLGEVHEIVEKYKKASDINQQPRLKNVYNSRPFQDQQHISTRRQNLYTIFKRISKSSKKSSTAFLFILGHSSLSQSFQAIPDDVSFDNTQIISLTDSGCAFRTSIDDQEVSITYLIKLISMNLSDIELNEELQQLMSSCTFEQKEKGECVESGALELHNIDSTNYANKTISFIEGERDQYTGAYLFLRIDTNVIIFNLSSVDLYKFDLYDNDPIIENIKQNKPRIAQLSFIFDNITESSTHILLEYLYSKISIVEYIYLAKKVIGFLYNKDSCSLKVIDGTCSSFSTQEALTNYMSSGLYRGGKKTYKRRHTKRKRHTKR